MGNVINVEIQELKSSKISTTNNLTVESIITKQTDFKEYFLHG